MSRVDMLSVSEESTESTDFDNLGLTKVCNISFLNESTPVVLVTPKYYGVDKEYFFANFKHEIERMLLKYGAIIFRQFDVTSLTDFRVFSELSIAPLMDYEERTTPRTSSKKEEQVYSSTEYHSRLPIYLHNENSYASSWPGKIMFWCARRASVGGESLLADCRKVYSSLQSELTDVNESSEIVYTRRFDSHIGLGWKEAFSVADEKQLEYVLNEKSYTWHWENDVIYVSRKSRWIRRHPLTDEPVWFNHALFFNNEFIASQLGVPKSNLEAIKKYMPYVTSFTSSDSDSRIMASIRRAYDEHTMSISLENGDVLFLDNMIMAHGRTSFRGERKMYVTMGQPYSNEQFK